MKKTLTIGSLRIGGGQPVRVESMLKTRLEDTEACLAQLNSLKNVGCELVRVAFPRMELAEPLKRLNSATPLPLMADIHFDPSLAEAAIGAGCPSIRINPGNMGDPSRLARVVGLARERSVVIRIGANSGSISAAQMKKARGDRGAALALAACEQMETLLSLKFEDVILSAKSTDLDEALRANILLTRRYEDFPFHVGITEAGSGVDGIVKSACGLSRLLALGIGQTLRVSLSQPPEDEVTTAYSILRALKLRQRGGCLISCPTCGRRQFEVAEAVEELKPLLAQLPDGFTLAVMGCEVNGPREARGAHLGVAGSPSGMVIFRNGEIVRRLPRGDLLSVLREYLPLVRKTEK